jgi:uncharacterized membrane protein
MYIKDHIWMGLIGIIGFIHSVKTYMGNGHIDLMALVFVTLSVLYFVSLVYKKGKQDDSNC